MITRLYTYHLNDGQYWFIPGQRTLNLWPKSAKEIIDVHDHVYTTV